MAAHVLRLRLSLLVGALRGPYPVRMVLGLLLAVGGTVAICVAVLGLADGPLQTARSMIVLGGAAVFLAFLFGPVVIGAQDQLDPRRFRVFALDEALLPWVLALAALCSIPSAALIAVAACVAVVEVRFGVPWPVAAGSMLLGVVCTALAARIGMAVSALLLPVRRSRELTALFALAVVVVAFPVAMYFASMEWRGVVPVALRTATDIIAVSPLGVAQGLPFAVADGSSGGIGLGIAMGVATLLGVAAVWQSLVRRLLTGVERPTASRERSGLGWFALMPANAFGAVAARSLVYWLRDRRYLVNIVIVPIAGVLTVLPLLVAGVPLPVAVLVPAPLIALFLGWLAHNDVAYDSTALWVHIASGMRGLPDRLGRLVPITLISLPLLAIAVSVTLTIADDWSLLMPFTGLVACLFLAALGVSSITSVVAPYAVSRPGDSPFQQPQRTSSLGSFGPALAFAGALLVSAPTIWLFIRVFTEGEHLAPLAFWCGAASGVVAVLLGVVVGGWIFERSGERLMEFAETT